MFFKLIKVMRSKWVFSKPKKKLLLIYDLPDLFERFIKKNQYEVLDIRYQSINIFILIKTIFTTGVNNLITNYKKNYLISVSPKLVFTSIDNDLSFFKLKNLYAKAKYACLQISLRDTVFLEQCKSYYKGKNAAELYSDFFYVYGKNDKIRLEKYISSKYILTGSVINNLYKIYPNKNIKKIIFIAQATFGPERLNQEIETFKKILKLSSDLNLPLFYLLKTRNNHFVTKKIKKYFKEYILKKKFYLIERNEDAYSHLNSSAIFFTNSSTLGFEAISRKKKVIFLPLNNFPTKNYLRKYPKIGPFWTTNHNYSNILKMSKKIIKLNQRKWSSIVNKNISEIINFKPSNPELIKLLHKNKIELTKTHFTQTQ